MKTWWRKWTYDIRCSSATRCGRCWWCSCGWRGSALHGLRTAIDFPVSRIGKLRERRSAARSVKPRGKANTPDDGQGAGIAWGGLATA
jgi:hypothetical protein